MLWGISKVLTDPGWVQGLGSLLAVVVALGLAVEQRKASERRRREDVAREHRADRAILVSALSALRQHAGKKVRLTAGLLANGEGTQDNVRIPQGWKAPDLDPQVSRDIAKCIATAPNRDVARVFGSLLEFLQIESARITRIEENTDLCLGPVEVSGHLYDAIKLAALTDRFFDYARMESDRTPKSVVKDHFESVAFVEGVIRDDPSFTHLFFLLDERGANP